MRTIVRPMMLIIAATVWAGPSVSLADDQSTRGDRLPMKWQVPGGNSWNERTAIAKKGDSVATVLRELGATPDEIKAITALLGRLRVLAEGPEGNPA